MNTLKKLKKRLVSKTYISALALGLITAVDMNTGFISGLFAQEYRPWLLMIWPVVMMTLREMTRTALDESTNDTDPSKSS